VSANLNDNPSLRGYKPVWEVGGRKPRLTAAQARFVRKAVMLRAKLTNRAMARKYGVDESTIGNYIAGRHKASPRVA
jgi:hypothetical protein